jgi:hypothetical protein
MATIVGQGVHMARRTMVSISVVDLYDQPAVAQIELTLNGQFAGTMNRSRHSGPMTLEVRTQNTVALK